jgi:hypothetical protein
MHSGSEREGSASEPSGGEEEEEEEEKEETCDPESLSGEEDAWRIDCRGSGRGLLAYVSICQQTSAYESYVSIQQHTATCITANVSIRQRIERRGSGRGLLAQPKAQVYIDYICVLILITSTSTHT